MRTPACSIFASTADERQLEPLVEIDELARAAALPRASRRAAATTRPGGRSRRRRRRRRGRACPRRGRASAARARGTAARGPRACTSLRRDRGGTPSARCRAASDAQLGVEAVHQLLGAVRDERRELAADERAERLLAPRPSASRSASTYVTSSPVATPSADERGCGRPRRPSAARARRAPARAARSSTASARPSRRARCVDLDLERLGLGRLGDVSPIASSSRGSKRAELELVEQHPHLLAVELALARARRARRRSRRRAVEHATSRGS